MEKNDDQWKRIYAHRLKGRADLIRLIDDQEHTACVGACGDCPLGLNVMQKPGHAPCAFPMLRKIVVMLVPVKRLEDSALSEIIASETELIERAADAFKRGDKEEGERIIRTGLSTLR